MTISKCMDVELFSICNCTKFNICIILESESVRSGTPVKLDDVSGYGTADSCSDKTPPYLPTNRGHQQPFESILREDSRTDFSSGSGRSARVSDKISNSIVFLCCNFHLISRFDQRMNI